MLAIFTTIPTFSIVESAQNMMKYVILLLVLASWAGVAGCDTQKPYSIETILERFTLSFDGDRDDIELNPDCTDNPHTGQCCTEIAYSADVSNGYGFVGIYWLYPKDNWGGEPGWKDVFTGATNLTFWARGKEGGEKVKFEMGGIAGEYSDSIRLAKSTRIISLSDEWKQYSIDLTGKDLSHVIGGFRLTIDQEKNPNGCTVYLDDARYEWW